MRRTFIGGLAIATMLSLASAFPVSAGVESPTPPPEKTPICKTVFVNIATAPALSVTLGGKTQTVSIDGVLFTSVTVCVSASAEVLANLVLQLDTPTFENLCLTVNGSLRLMASTNVAASVDVSITLNGMKNLAPVKKTISFPATPIAVDATLPISILACDP